MGSRVRLLADILGGRSDANIRFEGLRGLLLAMGFKERVKGSHHLFSRPGIEEIINLQPKGGKAKVYQVRQVRDLILRHELELPDGE